jgi:DNA methylase
VSAKPILTGKSLEHFGEPLDLPLNWNAPSKRVVQKSLANELASFREFGQQTKIIGTKFADANGTARTAPTFVNEFWTARQRQGHSLHEVSYRACFKPQLPRFFIERLSQPGDVVYDPFMGRGTTPMEAALLGRVPIGNDINPLSIVMLRPRLAPPTLNEITARLYEIDFSDADECPDDLLAFYHPETLRAIGALKKYFRLRRGTPASGPARFDHNSHRIGSGIGAPLDPVDEWIEMISLNRLTGHSPGFFSVYTLPPNQAVSVKSQLKINAKRNQTPPPRDVVKVILKKSRQLLGDCDSATRKTLASVAAKSLLLTTPAAATPKIRSNSISLVVTSPPFLDVVQYADDNWLRCWFAGIDPKTVKLTVPKKLDAWKDVMTEVFRELYRVLKPGGHVAFEVGEVHGGKTKLEETVLPSGLGAGLEPVLVLINDQKFTKTANCWGVDNMAKGTNTNRIVLFKKPVV